MRKYTMIAGSLALLSAIGMAACATAPEDEGTEGADPRPAEEAVSRRLRAAEAAASDSAARPHLDRIMALRADLGLRDDDAFKPISVHRNADGSAACRLQQLHKGVRVLDAVVISQADGAGNLTGIVNRARAGIDISTQPRVDEARALQIAAAHETHRASYSAEPRVELVIQPLVEDVDRATGERIKPESPVFDDVTVNTLTNAEQIERRVTGYRLAYQIKTMEGREGKERVNAMEYLVDATTGEIVRARSLLHEGVGTGSPLWVAGPVSFQTSGSSGSFNMYDAIRNYQIYDDDGVDTDANNTWGDGQPFTNASAANRQTAMVDVALGADVYWDMMLAVFNHAGPDLANPFYAVNGYVHVTDFWGNPMSNAYYNSITGNMSFGDGTNGQTFTHPDVVSHESAHALNDFTAGLSGDEAGGLNESSSDIFACITESYRLNSGWSSPGQNGGTTIPASGTNWFISQANRSMIKPSSQGSAHPDAYFAGIGDLDEHDAAEPNNRAFFFLAQGANPNMQNNAYSSYLPLGMAGVGMHKAAKIWHKALTSYLTSGSTYTDARNACISAAQSLTEFSQAERDAMVVAVKNAYAGINVGTRDASYPVVPNAAETEPNNTMGTANLLWRPVTPKPTGSGPDKLSMFGKGADVDYFVYSATKGEKVLLRLASASSYDYNIYVYDSFGSLVGSSTAGANALDFVSFTGTGDLFGTPGSKSDYFVKIVPVVTGTYSWYLLDIDFT
ncbi:MAG: M4 family metallopeptidase [Minicystis sp.]